MSKLTDRIPVLIRSPLRFGLIGGVLGGALVSILYAVGSHPFLIPVYLDFRIVLLSVFVIFSLKELRDYYYKGLLYFWQGMIASFVLTGTFALVAALLLFAFGEAIPGFVSSYVDQSIELLKGYPTEVIEQIGQETFDLMIATLPDTTAFDLASMYFWRCFVIGLFVSIIISVILRRQPQIQ